MEIVKILKVPCFVTWNGMDVIKSDNPFYGGRVGTYGGPGRNFGIQILTFYLLLAQEFLEE